jgi:hypothetical protein
MSIDELSPEARRLAVLASLAGRLDRRLLRSIRLHVASDIDAAAESDLWFSDAVARRTVSDITLRTELLDQLRVELVASGAVEVVRSQIEKAHAGGPPLLELEERLIYDGVRGASIDALQRLIGQAFTAMREHVDRSLDIASWALRTLPRLPLPVRSTAAAWSLAFAAEQQCGRAVELGTDAPLTDLTVNSTVGHVEMTVRRVDGQLLFNDGGARLRVAATTPRVVLIEQGYRRRALSLMPEQRASVDVNDAPVRLSNLFGESWSVEDVRASRPVNTAKPYIELGYWLLVYGTSHDLTAEEVERAHTLGATLASAGWSLIVIGEAGMAGAVANGFVKELHGRGFSSCRYRLLRIMSHDAGPPADRFGKAIYATRGESGEQAALARASAALLAGPIPHNDSLRESVFASALPYETLTAAVDKSWTMTIGERLASLQLRLRSLPAVSLVPAILLAAARALDETDSDQYNRQIESLRAMIDPTAVSLVTDPRASHRLVAYLADPFRFDVVVDALLAEFRELLRSGETRTLGLALDQVLTRSRKRSSKDQQRLATVRALLVGALERDRAEPDAAIRRQLDALTDLIGYEARERTATLMGFAQEYESIRATQLVGGRRTEEMTDLVNQISEREGRNRDLGVWFSSGLPGARIVALALALYSDQTEHAAHALSAVATPLSAFEQYTALRVLRDMLERLGEDELRTYRDAIETQRSDGILTPDDISRWGLASDLLEIARERLDETVEFSMGNAVLIGVESPTEHGVRTFDELRVLTSVFSEFNLRIANILDEVATRLYVGRALADVDPDDDSDLSERGVAVVSFVGSSEVHSGRLMLCIGNDEQVTVRELFDWVGDHRDVVVILNCDNAGLGAAASEFAPLGQATHAVLTSCGSAQTRGDVSKGAFSKSLRSAFDVLRPSSTISLRDVFCLLRRDARGTEQRPELVVAGRRRDLGIGYQHKTSPSRRTGERKPMPSRK